MKKRNLFIIIFYTIIGCQDVIDVEVPSESPRLSIDALIRITDITQPFAQIQVQASRTSSFFEDIKPAQLSAIFITNEDSGESLSLLSATGNGKYTGVWAMQQLTQGKLKLTIEYEGQTYVARTQFVASVPIDTLVQGDATLFEGTETEVLVTFKDTPDRTDFYLFDFDFDEYLVSEDTFYKGQSFQFSYFYDDKVKPGIRINVALLGVDEPFYNYMNQLILQSNGDQGPFQIPVATVKGNIINSTSVDDFALGYFAVSQTFTRSLTLE
ncbi:MAG: DUF4249 family protein [Flavobacteriaceae bacterium]